MLFLLKSLLLSKSSISVLHVGISQFLNSLAHTVTPEKSFRQISGCVSENWFHICAAALIFNQVYSKQHMKHTELQSFSFTVRRQFCPAFPCW